MSYNFNTKTIAVVLAVLLAVASVGPAMAAEPSIDTDDTDGDGITDYAAGDTIVHNESADPSYLQYNADSESSKVTITGPDGNELYSNSSAETVNATNNAYRVAIDSVDDFDDLEVGAGENVTLDVTTINNTAATNPDTHNFTLYYQNTESSANILVTDADAEGDVVTFKELSIRQQIPFLGNDVKPASVEETFAISGTNTTNASFAISNTSTQDAFSESLVDAESGAWTPAAYVKANDHFIPVFAESSPDADWIDTDEDAYAVASSDGSEVTVHNLDAVVSDSDSEVTVSMTANEKMGFFNAKSMFEDLGAGATTWTIKALSAI